MFHHPTTFRTAAPPPQVRTESSNFLAHKGNETPRYILSLFLKRRKQIQSCLFHLRTAYVVRPILHAGCNVTHMKPHCHFYRVLFGTSRFKTRLGQRMCWMKKLSVFSSVPSQIPMPPAAPFRRYITQLLTASVNRRSCFAELRIAQKVICLIAPLAVGTHTSRRAAYRFPLHHQNVILALPLFTKCLDSEVNTLNGLNRGWEVLSVI